MPLLDFWKSSSKSVEQLSIEQIVSAAGDGILKDESQCSLELREYLKQISSSKIGMYVEHCLSFSFLKNGMVLQDLINELGRRLDYNVINGRYQGTSNTIGFDGLWLSPEGHSLIVEIKTTDTYRISLDTIAVYRSKLTESGRINGSSSILIVVGREDTGELEAQVRGSRHAWDIRLISVEALLKLVQLKENADGPETGVKIRSLLTPMEYTRLDRMIDVMFTAATDVEAVAEASSAASEGEGSAPPLASDKVRGIWQFTDSKLLQQKREAILDAIGRKTGTIFIKRSRALYWNASHENRLVCTLSKRYERKGTSPYWYAYHPQWHDFLLQGTDGHLVLGCMDLATTFAVPVAVISSLLEGLHITTKEDGSTYWHIHLGETSPGQLAILIPRQGSRVTLDTYRIPLL